MKEVWLVFETETVGHYLSSVYQVHRALSSVHLTQEGATAKAKEEEVKAEVARRVDPDNLPYYSYMVHGPWLVHP